MQALTEELDELTDRLEAELKTCKESGCQYAENEAERRRDCSEAIYKASQEAINVIKLRIRMVDAQITRIWNSGDVTQGGYL